jgi:hypothetical protein
MFTTQRLLKTFLMIVVAATACEATAVPPTTPVERFVIAASQRWVVLNPEVNAYARRADECAVQIEALGATYDAIMTNEPGRFRDALIDNYRRNLPAAFAERLNLQTEQTDLEREMDEMYDWLHQPGNDPFKVQTSYKDLDEVIRKGREAIGKVNRTARLPSLPDPIPDPVAPAEVVDIGFRDLGIKQDTWYPVEVRVKNNARYTDRIVTVEILVRSGPAKLEGPLKKQVTVQPGRTKLLTWRFMAIGDGEFDIGARVVEPE